MVTAILFLDLQKAFDTVSHDILLKKLQHYGIRGNVHRLFTSYLSGRKQFTKIESWGRQGVLECEITGNIISFCADMMGGISTLLGGLNIDDEDSSIMRRAVNEDSGFSQPAKIINFPCIKLVRYIRSTTHFCI